MAGVVIRPCPKPHSSNDGIFTKSIFLTTNLNERFSPAYFALQETQHLDLPFIVEMLQNHRKCPYWTLLKQICPCSLDIKRQQVKRKKSKQINVSTNETVPMQHVFLFVRRVVLKIIPVSAFGNVRNRNVFLKQLHKLLSMPNRGKISALFMTSNLKTKCMMWLKNLNQKEQGVKLLEFIIFLVSSFVGPLIQSFFYVTQSGSTNKLFFYRKKIWHSLLNSAYKKFRSKCKLKCVSKEWVDEQHKEGKCLGVSHSHFLPKTNSLRPVVNCSKKVEGRASVNEHLKSLHLVLSFERERHPEVFGASILGMAEFHQRWKKYQINMHKKRVRRYYCVKTDLKNCFNNIDPNLVYQIIKQLVTSSYIVYKYKKLMVVKGVGKTKYFESLKPPETFCNTTTNVTECIRSYNIQSDVLLEKLKALLFCNVVKLGSQLFLQTVGIPQGACISSLLCAAYFGFMDKTACDKFLRPHNILVRMVDDMLFVSPHKEEAKRFLQLMLDGIPTINCRINFQKCCINFSYDHPILGKVPSVGEKEQIKYCGVCVNTKTLEIGIDFSNHKNTNGVSVSWDLTQRVGSVLQEKIVNSLSPKCFSVLFDSDINSLEQIEFNILCIFGVCSLKFHHLIMNLPRKRRALQNPRFFTRIIQRLPNLLHMQVSRALKKISKVFHKDLSLPFTLNDLRTLCNCTFLYKLQNHHVCYSSVIDRLLKIEGKRRLEKKLSKQLQHVFHSIHPK